MRNTYVLAGIVLLTTFLEGVVFAQLPILGVVPGVSLVVLWLAFGRVQPKVGFAFVLLSGIVLDVLRVGYSPSFTLLYFLLGLVMLMWGLIDREYSFSYIGLVVLVCIKHAFFYVWLRQHVSVVQVGLFVTIETILLLVLLFLVRNKKPAPSEVYA